MINRGPSKPLDLAILEEIWTGKEVKLSHLKVFGCVSYVHVNDHARSKLDAKLVECTLVGYGEDEFGYKLWDDQNRKMIRSRDVVFNGKVTYKDRNIEKSDHREPDYFGPKDVSGGRIVEHGSQKDEEQGVQPQVEELIPQDEIPTPHSPIGQRVLNPKVGNALRISPTAQSTLRKSNRPDVPNRRYLQYLLLTDAGEPECYDEACQGEDASKWELAMKEEMKSLVSN